MTGSSPRMRFEARVALVTGAAQGMGLESARSLLAEGARVVLFDRNRALLDEAESALSEIGEVAAVAGDAAVRADVAAATSLAVDRFGGLDVVVANAGIGDVRPFLEIDDEGWHRILDVNLNGVFYATQEGARAIIATAGRGAVVVTASTNAFSPERHTVHYSTSKGGVVAFVRAAALDLAGLGVRVNAVSPGIIRTPLAAPLTEDADVAREFLRSVPMTRFGESSEIADTVLFLASDESSYITGQNIVVDGGTTLGMSFEMPNIGEAP
jgi:NAD(P)-dependent dehydrogenase (short-subunit alcohol dehydrogenase family)